MRLMILDSGRAKAIDPTDAMMTEIGPALAIKDRYRFPFSYVVDLETMLPVASVLEYLTYQASARNNGRKTIKNKADGCYELLLYLSELGIDYRDVCKETLIEYKERLCAFISGKTNRPLEPGTVSNRLQVAREFLTFHKVLISDDVTEVKGGCIDGSRRHQTRGEKDPLTVEVRSKLVEYVGDRDLMRLLASLGDPPGTVEGRPSRDWLLSTVCVTTGVRLSEALALTLNQLVAAASMLTAGVEPQIRLTETKFSKARDISVPKDLIDLLQLYVNEEREAAMKIGRKARPRTRDTSRIFVNGSECAPRYAGLPYQGKRADEFFAQKQMAIGMTRTVPLYDPDTREVVGDRQVPRNTIHHLRHTYAVRAWQAYRDAPEVDRWMRIQAQLGHKSHEVTAQTYLRAVKHVEGVARDALGSFLKSLVIAR